MQNKILENKCYLALGIRKVTTKAPYSTLDCYYPLIFVVEKSAFPQDKFTCLVNGSAVQEHIKKIEKLPATALVHGSEEQKQNFLKAFTNGPIPADKNNPLSSYYQAQPIIAVLPTIANNITCTEEAYLKLHLISTLLLRPHMANLNNIFAKLPTICFTTNGPILANDINFLQQRLAVQGTTLSITHVDKFPYLTNYITPREVRIASSNRVRLGAHLSPGTTVMPAGFVNFNAGTLGPAMIEGRVSAGVIIGKNSDIGGGASIMGTLSGGGKEVIKIGEECLLGANSGTGISLGFGCTIAAGTYVTAGAKVYLQDAKNNPITLQNENCISGENICYGKDLSGRDNLLFYVHSHTGCLVAKPNPRTAKLNKQLHNN